MAQHQDLCFQRASRPEQTDQRTAYQSAEIAHGAEGSPDSLPPANRIRFATETATSLDPNLWRGGVKGDTNL